MWSFGWWDALGSWFWMGLGSLSFAVMPNTHKFHTALFPKLLSDECGRRQLGPCHKVSQARSPSTALGREPMGVVLGGLGGDGKLWRKG